MSNIVFIFYIIVISCSYFSINGCSFRAAAGKFKPRAVVTSISNMDLSYIADIKTSGITIVNSNIQNDNDVFNSKAIYSQTFFSHLQNHLTTTNIEIKNYSRYLMYFKYDISDGQNFDIDVFFPMQNREVEGSNFIKSGIGWGQIPELTGLNLFAYKDVDIQRMNYIGGGHAHMLKGTVTKRIYQKTLEIAIYDSLAKRVLQYIKVDGFTECPFISKDIINQYLKNALSTLSQKGEFKTEFSIKEKCTNDMFARY